MQELKKKPTVTETIRLNRLRWFGHVERMEESRIPKRVLYAIQINHQPDATIFQFIILMFIYSSTCFGRCPAPSSGAQLPQ